VCVWRGGPFKETVPARVIPSGGEATSSGDTPALVEEEVPFKTSKSSGKLKYTVLSPDGARNQDLLLWRRPAAI
jgi:hypothetical protein